MVLEFHIAAQLYPIVDYLNTILNDDIIIDGALEQGFVSRKHQIENIVNDRRAAKTIQIVHVVDVLNMLIDHDYSGSQTLLSLANKRGTEKATLTVKAA